MPAVLEGLVRASPVSSGPAAQKMRRLELQRREAARSGQSSAATPWLSPRNDALDRQRIRRGTIM